MTDALNCPDYVGPSQELIIDQAFDRIATALITKDAQFLFGSGMSKASGLPTGEELSRKLLEIFFPPSGSNMPSSGRIEELAREFPLEAIVAAIMKKPGTMRKDLTVSLKKILLDPNYNKPSQAHHDFLSVFFWGASPRFYSVFTTNFDTIFEQLFGTNRAKPITAKNTKEIMKAYDQGLIPIIHLHGALDDESYIITESDVFSEDYRILTHAFRAALSETDTFVFVGYSLMDPDFRRVYMNYREEIEVRGKADKWTYIVGPAKDNYSYLLGQKIWETRRVIWIPLTAQEFFKKLKHVMQHKSDKEALTKVREKYDITDEDALDELIEAMADTLRIDSTEALYFLADLHPPIRDKK